MHENKKITDEILYNEINHCMLISVLRSLFALFLLVIAMSVLRFLASDYPSGIFKLFFR